ncbi:MAG: PH domain-containing protein [Saprospiraceae bacterium]|nr:PH domain-containing protein [Saprospiraceae bacterium]MCB9325238.1 PH domain-containing protein [Lewinellaceae bacterium]
MVTNLQNELRQHLNQGESLLWTGTPKKGILFNSGDLFLIPFSIFWCGFAIFWMYGASEGGGIFALFGIPFVVIGLYLLFGRFFLEAAQRANTVYGITNTRIIIKSGIYSKTVKSLQIKTLADIQVTEKTDGSGTITIGAGNPYNAKSVSLNRLPGVPLTPVLELIPNARKVFNQIVELQQEQ